MPLRQVLKRKHFLVGIPCPDGLGMLGQMTAAQVRLHNT
jgi:hypothetical protein